MNTDFTVEKLRKAGYKVRVTHVRDCGCVMHRDNGEYMFSKYEFNELKQKDELVNYGLPYGHVSQLTFGQVVRSTGGFTVVEVTTPDGETLRGKYNHGERKPFIRKKGVMIALNKALYGKN